MFESVLNEVVTREYRPRNSYTFSRRKCIPLIGVSNFECHKNQAFHLHSCIDAASPPFDCDFSPRAPSLLLVAKEDGLVHLFDTEQLGSESLLKYYGVHDNAIFSVKWVTHADQFLTASGDQTIKLIDSETGSVVSVYVGHTMSVRSLALSPEDHHIFASASRDGSVRLWDMRTQNSEGVGSSAHIQGCHLPSIESSSRRSRSKSRKSMTDSQSVTSVVFAREFELVSTGSTDGTIKIWDIRKITSLNKIQPQPITSLPYNGISRKQCGYSDLVLDSNRRRLYASCLDHAIYEYDLTSTSTRPALLYTGHLTGSFYIKLSLSPDDAYLACGSADSRAYIYRVGARTQRPFVLSGHTGEVSVPRWSFHDPTRLVTLSDTAQLFVWRMFPAREYTIPEAGQLRGLTECLSQPTVTAEHQRSLLVPVSTRSTAVVLATKSSPISSKSGGDALDSFSLLAKRRRQLNIRDFLMDLPQAGGVNGSNLIDNSGGSNNNTHSSTLSPKGNTVDAAPEMTLTSFVSGSQVIQPYPFPPSITTAAVAVATSSSSPTPSLSYKCNSDANPPLCKLKSILRVCDSLVSSKVVINWLLERDHSRNMGNENEDKYEDEAVSPFFRPSHPILNYKSRAGWDEEDVENNPPSSSSASTDSHSHHRYLRRHCNHRYLGLSKSTGQEGMFSPLSDITKALSQPSRKRPMEVNDGVGKKIEDHESSLGSQSPTWSKHSTTTEASVSASSSSLSMGTGSPGGTPRRRRRTMVSKTSSTSNFSPSLPNRRRRRSTLRPAVVASGRNSIRNYFKPSED
ncbi:Denticleless -like protein [Echinococcus granulosus]|nr:Denticleless -like protein [Echinococcus granulosus]